jgi:DNA-directed RNA polymerase specialized sigma subunit
MFWRDGLQSQVYLGDENFVQRMQAQIQPHQQQDKQIPKVQRRHIQSWSAWLAECQGDRDQALYLAYQQGGMTMTQLAKESGLSISHVSRLIAKRERGKWEA